MNVKQLLFKSTEVKEYYENYIDVTSSKSEDQMFNTHLHQLFKTNLNKAHSYDIARFYNIIQTDCPDSVYIHKKFINEIFDMVDKFHNGFL